MICMSAKTFVDTNILIYAYDLDAGIKHDRAKACLQELWNLVNSNVKLTHFALKTAM
jgi:predicted nucleic acid-binding protein